MGSEIELEIETDIVVEIDQADFKIVAQAMTGTEVTEVDAEHQPTAESTFQIFPTSSGGKILRICLDLKVISSWKTGWYVPRHLGSSTPAA